jgi:hypothetical protein
MNITQKTATIGVAYISFFALLYFFSGICWWTFLSSSFLVAVHAFFRDIRESSMHKDLYDSADTADTMSCLPLQENAVLIDGCVTARGAAARSPNKLQGVGQE